MQWWSSATYASRLTAKAGERLAIKLVKTDPARPHNLVLVKPGAYGKVGKARMKMLNEPHRAFIGNIGVHLRQSAGKNLRSLPFCG